MSSHRTSLSSLPRTLRVLLSPSLVALALATAAPAPAAEPGTEAASEPSSRKPGALGWILSSVPRKAEPWHQYGEFFATGGMALSMYGDHTASNNDGSLSAIDARDNGAGWHVNGEG